MDDWFFGLGATVVEKWKCSYAINRAIANFLLIKNTNWSYSQKWKPNEPQKEMLQVLGGLSTMQYYYCFKGMENILGSVCNMRYALSDAFERQ